MEPTLSQALHLLNGNTVNAKIQQGGVIKQLMEAEEVPRGADRRPLPPLPVAQADQGGARRHPADRSAKAPNQEAGARATSSGRCLNSREFLFNH